MQPLTLTHLPTEILAKILTLTNVKGVVGLLHITKQMKLTHEERLSVRFDKERP